MKVNLNLWGTKPVTLVIKATPVKSDSGNYTRVEIRCRGRAVVDHIPDMYPGEKLELKLRF